MNTTIKPRNRILSLGLALCLLLGMTLYLPGPVEVRAAVEIGTGDDLLVDTSGTTLLVYFGHNYMQNANTNGANTGYADGSYSPIAWRVVYDNNDGTLTLLSNEPLATRPYDSTYNHGTWTNSAIAAYLNEDFLNDSFDTREVTAMEENYSLDEETGYNAGDKFTPSQTIVLPSTAEIGTYTDNDGLWLMDQSTRAAGASWWLRTPGDASNNAAFVTAIGFVSPGNIASSNLRDTLGIRPAFRLNLSSVLFTSDAVGGKSSVGVANTLSSAAKPQSGAVKLTVLDNDQKLEDVALTGGNGTDTLEFSYTSAKTGPNQYISCVLIDDNEEVAYYGKLEDTDNAYTGTANVPLSGVSDGDYTLKIFSEQVGDDKETDYAGGIHEFNITVQSGKGSMGNSDATLATVAGRPINPTGGDGTTAADPYIAAISLGYSKNKIEVDDLKPADPSATVNLYADADYSMNEDADIDLDPDNPTILYVKVTAEDTTTVLYYKITATREAEPATATLTMMQPGNDTVKVDEPYTKTIEVNYSGSDIPLGFSASGLPNTLTIDSTSGTISGTPNTADTHNITVTATAGPLSDSKSFTLTVDSTATPTQLTLEAPADLTVTEGEPFTKKVSVTYVGPGTLTYTISGLPRGVTYSTTTGEITGPANLGTARDIPYSITVEVTDNNGNDANGSFDLIVLPASSPPPQSSHTITASAGIGGSISPSGNVSVADGDDQIFTITPNENYKISDVLVDDVSEGDVATYTFQNVTGDHTIHATFESTGGGSVNPDPDPTPAPSGSTRRGSSSGSGSSNLPTPVKTRLPASAFSWEGRILTIDHDSISVLGLLTVQWDGKTLTRGTDYGVYQGSVIVRFGEDFMATQSPGDHTVRVEFLNHTGETTVTVGDTGLTADEPNDDLFDNNTHNPNTGGYPDGSYPATDNPSTGDRRGIWFALLLGSIGAAALIKLRPRLEVK